MPITVRRTHKAQQVQTAMPELHVVPFNTSRAVIFYDHHVGGQAYERFMRHDVFVTNAVGIALPLNQGGGYGMVFQAMNVASASAQLDLAYPEYRLFIGDGLTRGTQRAVAHIPADSLTGPYDKGRALFRGTLGNEPDGPYMLTVVPYDANGDEVLNPVEGYVPFWIWIDRNGTAWNHPDVIYQNGSYDWTHPTDNPTGWQPYLWARVPKSMGKVREVPQTVNGAQWFYIPTVNTNPSNVGFEGRFPGGEPFSNAASPTTITRLNFAFGGTEDEANYKRWCKTSRGIIVTENIQSYFSEDWYAYTPQYPMLDGPRGVATVQQAVGMWSGHAGLTYCCDSFSFYRLDRDGTKTTFSGLRHVAPYPPYWEDRGTIHGRTPYDINDQLGAQLNIPGVEIVGTWPDNVPPERRFPWEPWGLTVDMATTKQDYAVPTQELAPFGQLPPHLGVGPAFFTTCRFNRILKFQFHKDNPSAPPVTTEFATGLNDPWGICTDTLDGGRTLYVTERQNHRISKWNLDTGAYLGDALNDPTAFNSRYGYMGGQTRRAWRLGPASCPTRYPPAINSDIDWSVNREPKILAPEGCAYMDGYVYFASLAQAEVRRLKLSDGTVEVCCRPFVDYVTQSFYLYINVGDGSFGPRGTIFTTTYDVSNYGRPHAYIPSPGVAADGTPLTHSQEWTWTNASMRVPKGPGGRTVSTGYGTACNISNGMLSCSSSLPGLSVFVKATLGEPATNEASAVRGWEYFCNHYYRFLHGNNGYGYINAPLPWGENADCDYWLQLSGHVKPA